MTDQPAEIIGSELELVHPSSGEVVDLKAASTDELAVQFDRLLELRARLDEFGQAIVNEVAERMDRRGERKTLLGDVELEVNAPSSEEYLLDVLRGELEALVAAGAIDEELVAKVIRTPPPAKPEPRVDKREVNKLKKSTDRRVLAAIAKARDVKSAKRTLKVKGVER